MKSVKKLYKSRITGFLTACILLFAFISSYSAASAPEAERRLVRVAFPEAEGYSMTDESGEHYGLVVDYLDEIAKYTGWTYEYCEVSNEDFYERFRNGEYDLLGGQFYSEGLEAEFAYPDYSCGNSRMLLLARSDDESITAGDYSSFNGKTIGVYENAIEGIRRLKIYIEMNDIDCELKYYTPEQMNEHGSLVGFLENGEVDLILSGKMIDNSSIFVADYFISQPHYIVARPGDDYMLEQLNMALESIYESDPAFAETTYEKNFPSVARVNSTLRDGEQRYVKNRGVVKVSVPRDWHPMNCMENDDHHDGIMPEVLTSISDYSGLEFELVYSDTYDGAFEMVQNGEADVLGFYLDSEKNAAKQFIAVTEPYVQMNFILVRNKNSAYPSEGLKGAVVKGNNLPSHIEASEVFFYNSANEALADVSNGTIDFFYGISTTIESILQKSNYPNLMQANTVNDARGIGFGMTSPVDRDLFAILNKAINHISAEEKSAILNRNLILIGEEQVTLMGLIYANPTITVFIGGIIFLVITLSVIIISTMRIHTAAMRAELAQAEAATKAKSDFFSRMSHEIRTPMNAIVGLTDIIEQTDGLPEKAKESLVEMRTASQYLLGLINEILDMSRIENNRMEIAAEPFSMKEMLDEVNKMVTQMAADKGIALEINNYVKQDVLVGDAIRLRQVLINLLSNAIKFTLYGGRVTVDITQEFQTETEVAFTVAVKDNGIGIAKEDQSRIFNSFEQVGPNFAKSQGTGLGLSICKNIIKLMGSEIKLESRVGAGSNFYFTLTLPKGVLPQKSEEASAEGLTFDGMKILVVEDNIINTEIITELLKMRGAEVDSAENGIKGLEAFKKSREGEYAVVLMDIMMPEMDGLETTAALRALNRRDAKTTPIIAMTANAYEKDERLAFDSGMNGFVSKPIDVNALYRTIQRLLDENQK